MNGRNGRYVAYDHVGDLFDGFQQANQGSNTTTTSKPQQQQGTSPFAFMNSSTSRGGRQDSTTDIEIESIVLNHGINQCGFT